LNLIAIPVKAEAADSCNGIENIFGMTR